MAKQTLTSWQAIFGLKTDLGLDIGNRYSFAASIFYLGFICGAYPAILMAQRWPIQRVAFGILVIWGACLMCTAACTTYRGLYAQRFFLGFLEAGIPPMFMMVVGGWYTKGEQAFRMGAWYACSGYISSFSPLINYGIGHITGGSLHPWQYMYLLAGAITFLFSFVVLWVLPSDPVTAKGFTDRERYIAVARMRENNSGVRNTHFKVAQMIEALTDIKFLLAFATTFLLTIVNGPVSSFVPIIIQSFGFSTLNSLLLSMPGGFYGGTWELLAPFLAYKLKNARCYLIFASQVGVCVAMLLLWLLPRHVKGGLLVGVYLMSSFGGGYAVLMGLQLANTSGYTKRSVTSSGIYIGYCLGNFLGPLLFKEQDAPDYTPGFIASFITAAVAGVLILVYRVVAVLENKKRDRTGTMEAFDHAYEDDLTDRKVSNLALQRVHVVALFVPVHPPLHIIALFLLRSIPYLLLISRHHCSPRSIESAIPIHLVKVVPWAGMGVIIPWRYYYETFFSHDLVFARLPLPRYLPWEAS